MKLIYEGGECITNKIEIFDSPLRDGAQAEGISFSNYDTPNGTTRASFPTSKDSGDTVEFQKRKLHRLREYDYGQYGYYYVTVCSAYKRNILCDIVGNDALVVPSAIGEKVIECWLNIERFNENVVVDKFVLMPNHIHGIIIIKNHEAIKIKNKQYGFEISERRGRRSLQGLIKDFKSVTTRHYKKMLNTTGNVSLWQASYYDEIIKDEEHYQGVCQYIDTNPVKWVEDSYYYG